MDKNELISREVLHPLINEWLKPFIDEWSRLGGYWCNSSGADSFYWYLGISVGSRGRSGGSRLIGDYWGIYNDFYQEENINIKIFKDHIEFIEDSKFIAFTREEMYSLYTFLKEKIFGNKDELSNNIIKDPTNVNIFKHIKSVMRRYPEDSPEYNVLRDLYHTIKISFNFSYGTMIGDITPDYEKLIKYANDEINEIQNKQKSFDDEKEEI